MPRRKNAGEPLMFEGFTVPDVEFEITGGQLHETDLVIGNGDTVEGTFRAKVVNVKHPFKSGTVVRVQTCNVIEAELTSVVEKYVAPEPPAEQPALPVDE